MIVDYASLKDTVQRLTARGSVTDKQMSDWTQEAEHVMRHGLTDPLGNSAVDPLRVAEMVKTVELDIDDGEATLPTDHLATSGLFPVGLPETVISYMPPVEFNMRIGLRTKGDPQYYTIEGRTLRVGPAGGSYKLSFTYFQDFPGLTASTPNWIIAAHGRLYLEAVLGAAFDEFRNDEQSSKHYRKYNLLVGGLNSAYDEQLISGSVLVAVPQGLHP